MPKAKAVSKKRSKVRALPACQITREERLRVLGKMPLDRQLTQWAEWRLARAVDDQQAADAMETLRKKIRAVAREVPGDGWLTDVMHGNPELVGSWPPGRYERVEPLHAPGYLVTQPPPSGRLMPRAKGESRLYGQTYLTSSGHSYDVLLQRLYAGSTQWLTVNVAGHTASIRVGRKRKPRTLAGDLMLQIGTGPTRLETIIGEQDGQISAGPDRVQHALYELAQRFGVQCVDDYVWCPREKWEAFNRAALEYNAQADQIEEGDQTSYVVDGYMGSIVRINDLCPAMRKALRRGHGFQTVET